MNNIDSNKSNYTIPNLAKGLAAGYGVCKATELGINVIYTPIIIKSRDTFSLSEINEVKKALYNMINNSELKTSNIKIKELKPAKYKTYFQMYKDQFKLILSKKYRTRKKLNPALRKRIRRIQKAEKYKQGFKACFSDRFNFILLNMEKRSLSGFHELGHALNYKSNFWKLTKNNRQYAGKMAVAVLLTSLLLPECKKDKQNQNTFDKVSNFIRNNAGKLAFMTYLPHTIEEIEASRKGLIYAKKFLSPKLFKKAVVTNIIGNMSYVILATSVGIGVYLANKVRDKIFENSTKKTTV